tara:strand:+ start:1265 stop:1894 length:630 start_codon:yes stop_codon:yes gene_type:complete
MKKFLHVGPGGKDKSQSSHIFKLDDWEEIRLDVNKSCNPDILGSMTDLSMIDDNSYQGLCSSHNLEHIYAHEVQPTLNGFARILDIDCELLIEVPDLKVCAKAILEGNYAKPLYESPAGPIMPLDMIYGHTRHIASGNHYMAHKMGFTSELLFTLVAQAGFQTVVCFTSEYSIHCLATKRPNKKKQMQKRLLNHLGLDESLLDKLGTEG